MDKLLQKFVSNIAKSFYFVGVVVALSACTDTSYNVPEDAAVVIVQPPEAPQALSVVIAGVVVNQTTGNVVKGAKVDFFEGSQKATNILSVDDKSALDETLILDDGSFQVTAENLQEFKVVVSAEGYLDKIAVVKLDSQAQIVTTILELIPQDIKAYAANNNDFAVNDGIILTSDNSNSAKNTKGQTQVSIGGANQFFYSDSQTDAFDGASINLEVNYLESQPATAEDEAVSIASLIPQGLNSDDNNVDGVLVPVGVTEVNMTDQNGRSIKSFSEDITITVLLPSTAFDPIEDNLKVRSFDTETLTWSTEPDNKVQVLAEANDLLPVEISVNHLTIFALATESSACENPVTFNFGGDAVPASGLELAFELGDLRQTIPLTAVNSGVLTIFANQAKEYGIIDSEGGYKVSVKDYSGKVWSDQVNYELCGKTINLTLEDPAVSETLSLNLVCNNDNLVSTPLANAIVSYRENENAIPLIAAQTSPGSYLLTSLDENVSSYSIEINTRTKAGIVSTTITPDENNESEDIGIACSSATGTGTGTGSGSS
ncbi:MAG: hypothetical protein ACPHYD_00545 [Porticoccaceae bacterium]